MSVETHVHRAHDAVEGERDVVEEKLRAFTPEGRLVKVSVDGPATSSRPATVAGQRQSQAPANEAGWPRAVRTAFAETLAPHCTTDGADESILATLQSEFGESVVVALARRLTLR